MEKEERDIDVIKIGSKFGRAVSQKRSRHVSRLSLSLSLSTSPPFPHSLPSSLINAKVCTLKSEKIVNFGNICPTA